MLNMSALESFLNESIYSDNNDLVELNNKCLNESILNCDKTYFELSNLYNRCLKLFKSFDNCINLVSLLSISQSVITIDSHLSVTIQEHFIYLSISIHVHKFHQTLPKASPSSEKPPSKRQRKGSSPKQGHTNSVGYS
jgi:hypothetical protein